MPHKRICTIFCNEDDTIDIFGRCKWHHETPAHAADLLRWLSGADPNDPPPWWAKHPKSKTKIERTLKHDP